VLLEQGREDEALLASRRAIDLDPLSPARRLSLAYAAFPLGEYDVVIAEARRATELEPELTTSRALEGRALLLNGRAQECVTLELGPHEGVRAACLWSVGRRDEAQAIVDSLTRVVRAARVDSVYTDVVRVEDLACYYTWTGDRERALEWLEEAYRLSPIGVDHRVLQSALFDRLRQDPDARQRVERLTGAIWPRVKASAARARLP
jgi:tetratricopeptide (TPR) repeat protein